MLCIRLRFVARGAEVEALGALVDGGVRPASGEWGSTSRKRQSHGREVKNEKRPLGRGLKGKQNYGREGKVDAERGCPRGSKRLSS